MNNPNQMTLDQINEFKQQMQNLIPLVELLKIKARPNTLMGLERDQKLACMGFTGEEIEEMTGFKRGEFRFLDCETSEEVKIRGLGKEVWEKLQALENKCRTEWEAEYDRVLSYLIAQGSVEEICIDSKL
jgi:hypothetical protein